MTGDGAHLGASGLGPALPDGVVFDCDGTLADTESLSHRAWTEVLAGHGYAVTDDDFRAIIGHPFPHNWAYFAARASLRVGPDELRLRLQECFTVLTDTQLAAYPDAAATLRALADRDVPVAVASSSSHQHVLRVLERAGVRDLVEVVVGADDVERHKPDPEPYLAAVRALGLAPAGCAAVEDTATGVASAAAAGLFTVAVVRPVSGARGLDAADRVVDEITLDALSLPSERRGPSAG